MNEQKDVITEAMRAQFDAEFRGRLWLARLADGAYVDDYTQGAWTGYQAALSAQPAPREHQWDRDGERCTVCGDKDWMGGPCNGPRQSAQPAERQVALAWMTPAGNVYGPQTMAEYDCAPGEKPTPLYPAAPVGVPDAPLSVFSKGSWTYSGTGQSFDEKAMDEAAFVAYRDYFAAAPSAPQIESAQKGVE